MVNDENAAFANRDVDRALTVFADDAVLMPPDQPISRGKDDIRTWFAARFADSTLRAGTTTSDDLTFAGDWAFERLILRDSSGQAVGKVLHVYRRQPDGAWKVAQDIFNLDANPDAGRQ